QAEDGIRDFHVTGVQTCALPISLDDEEQGFAAITAKSTIIYAGDRCDTLFFIIKGSVTILIEDDDGREMIIAYLNAGDFFGEMRSEERRVGKESRAQTAP